MTEELSDSEKLEKIKSIIKIPDWEFMGASECLKYKLICEVLDMPSS